MTYAFTFDASACSGCKACQIACMDKNKLPTGVHWRRVYEISGGTWEQQENAWVTDTFAYYLSIACNHCVHPKCAGVCPTDAYEQREDGIVYINGSKCMGCGYCKWACPYDVPQYHPVLGIMTKCNFCMDEIDSGLLPSCVVACPMRVLDFVDIGNELWTGDGIKQLWKIPAANHPFPLADFSRTEPHLALQPHPGMLKPVEKRIFNLEEVSSENTKSDASLVTFTLLGQMAVGAFLAVQWMFRLLWSQISISAILLQLIPFLLVGVCLGLAGIFSFAHLGTKKNAWRALTHLRKSWLSREVWFAGFFGLGLTISTLILIGYSWPSFINWVTVLLGFGLVYSMAQVYRLHSVPAWDSWRTNVGFFITALLTGHLFMAIMLVFEADYTGIHLHPFLIRTIIGFTFVLLIGRFLLQTQQDGYQHLMNYRLRIRLIVVGLVLCLVLLVNPSLFNVWSIVFVFLIVMLEETLGRWLFYDARKKTHNP